MLERSLRGRLLLQYRVRCALLRVRREPNPGHVLAGSQQCGRRHQRKRALLGCLSGSDPDERAVRRCWQLQRGEFLPNWICLREQRLCFHLQRLHRLCQRLLMRERKLPQVKWRGVHGRWRMRKWPLPEQWEWDKPSVLRGSLRGFLALRDQSHVPSRRVRVPAVSRCLCGCDLLLGRSFVSVCGDMQRGNLRPKHHALHSGLHLLCGGVRQQLFRVEPGLCHRLHLRGHNLPEDGRPTLRCAR